MAFLPSLAAADWSPRPLLFTYEATLDTCVADPNRLDLARNCEKDLSAAYVLKRAVALAAFECGFTDAETCAAPFEDEGLPALAASIAIDVGCDATAIATLPEDEPFPPNHCVTVASDIMIDEGVVPLRLDIYCGINWIECGELALINDAFWKDQVEQAAPDDPLIRELQLRNIAECEMQSRDVGGWAIDLNALECTSARSASLWADLAQGMEQEN
ncbi:hypothetical protein L0666_09095 [Octadecabacter sp. CECT 8868]|uniref:hypothetical protein n=1 Tax=Octadecabacter algicola TaxID=2909342 RepID=UPI001F22E0FA|nr:hypothetical protein [Octadecabacter algicola]MCF2905143.1 hypothetical protein [Octadecabacter algicola]